jgi:hypothetical protein
MDVLDKSKAPSEPLSKGIPAAVTRVLASLVWTIPSGTVPPSLHLMYFGSRRVRQQHLLTSIHSGMAP